MEVQVEFEGLDRLRARLRELEAGMSREPNEIQLRSVGTTPAFLAAIHAKPIQRPELLRNPFFWRADELAAQVLAPVGAALARVAASGLWGGWRPALEQIATRWVEAVHRNFDEELSAGTPGVPAPVSASPSRMRPLTPRYAARKLRRYGPKTILRATDALYRSIRATVSREG